MKSTPTPPRWRNQDTGQTDFRHGHVAFSTQVAVREDYLPLTRAGRLPVGGTRLSHPVPADPLRPALWVGLCAVFFEVVLKTLLYFRPNPLGAAFALDPFHYVFHAIYYAAWTHGLVALPFAASSLLRERRRLAAGHTQGASRGAHPLQLGLSALLLLVGTVDGECQRFLGMHMTVDWIRTYGAVQRTPDVIWGSLRDDRGGGWSSLGSVALSLLFVPCAAYLATARGLPRFGKRALLALGFIWVVLPTLLWNVIPGGRQRQSKVRPALILAWREAMKSEPGAPAREVLASAVSDYQSRWRTLDSTHGWTFDRPDYPLRKHFTGQPAAQPVEQPNIIVLALETFRAKDMASVNPEFQGTAPTPFLDSLARRENSAVFSRYYASGVPTVYAFTAIHTSLLPHPRKGMHNEATTQNIEGFPSALQAHGYRTLHFTGSDPDWDSQRVWLNRWYDEVDFSPADRERDRVTFRRAATRLKEVGKSDKPFFAYLSSISNHTPFRSPEPALDIHSGGSARERLHNTMHYTDDVVRELYESLRNEPWFERTIWVITGDHGFDLGDRGESGGHDNLRHETTWVPLIVHGNDARLPRGRQLGVASHLDLAPTITELAGVWDDNSYMGHSLLHQDHQRSWTVIGRAGNYAYEAPEFSLYAGKEAAPFVYAGADLEQRRELAQPPATLLGEASSVAGVYDLLVGYTVDFDRVAPR
jgi:arylsulfatase A-like enzyme